MKATPSISHLLSFFTIIVTLPPSTVAQPTDLKDADHPGNKNTPTRHQVPEWESSDAEYKCSLGATNPHSGDVTIAAGKLLDMITSKYPAKALCLHTHADCTNIISHGSASIDYCGGSLGSMMYCETIAQMALQLVTKCVTPDGADEPKLHSGGMVLVDGHMKVTVY